MKNFLSKMNYLFAVFAILHAACMKKNGEDSYNKVDATNIAVKGMETAELTHAPDVPKAITRKHATKVVVNLEAQELVKKMADGVDYTFWTFGGEVPGKFIRLRVGDEVEFNLSNHPDSTMPHNIDLHAVTGPGGGAVSSFTSPGHTSTFSFKALNPGIYVYHCATAPVGMHIANGMYGLILVEPEEGLSKVDREYYVMQGEFYTSGKYGQQGHQDFSMEKALTEIPDYVVFNGSVDGLKDANAITAKKGETIRLFVGNGGPNLVSSFHVIGEIFDKVQLEGGTTINHNVQTTIIPSGGAAIVEFKVEAPGTYILVDHSIFRAFNKGALGMLKVSGDKEIQLYSGKQKDSVYLPEGGAVQQIDGPKMAKKVAKTKAEKIAFGEPIFKQNCVACHQANGQGIPGAFPPLAKSDYIAGNKEKAIGAVVHGLKGEIVVNAKVYNGVMPAINLSSEDISNVLTYVYNQWGNTGEVVTAAEVEVEKENT